MEPTEPTNGAPGKATRLLRAVFDREPEEVTRDGVLFIAVFYLIALIYFMFELARYVLCGTK